jgi:2-polyprenyl-3-methyl-5-hydroxy-6-metoxy-1,4-benzoquinol methylase
MDLITLKKIESAIKRIGNKGCFKVTVIGEAEYPHEQFDLITSMDTMYFANNINLFVGQLYEWLKFGGSFICGYQEGDIMDKTKDSSTTELAKAFVANGMKYEVVDYTKPTFEMLKRKRDVILSMKSEFLKNGLEMWYNIIKGQSNSVQAPYEEYEKANARYIYRITK